MRIFVAYNIYGDIKAQALNHILKRSDITSTNMNEVLEKGDDDARNAFGKCALFFTSKNFRKHYELLITKNEDNSKYYDRFYNGVLYYLTTRNFGKFFANKFNVDKIDANGNYAGFKAAFRTNECVLILQQIFGLLSGISANINGDKNVKDRVDAEVNKFDKGGFNEGGGDGIEKFQNAIRTIVDSLGGTADEKKSKGLAEAWASIGSPILRKGKYECYCIRKWEDMKEVAAGSGWCVSNGGASGKSFFDGDSGYIYPNYDADGKPTSRASDPANAYYLICNNKKYVALINKSTRKGFQQFRGPHNSSIEFDRPSAVDIVALGLEVSRLIGGDNSDGDFRIIGEYERNLDSDGNLVSDDFIQSRMLNLEEGRDDEDDGFDVDEDNDDGEAVEVDREEIFEQLLKRVEEHGDYGGNFDFSWEASMVKEDRTKFDRFREAVLKSIGNGNDYSDPMSSQPSLIEDGEVQKAIVDAAERGVENSVMAFDVGEVVVKHPNVVEKLVGGNDSVLELVGRAIDHHRCLSILLGDFSFTDMLLGEEGVRDTLCKVMEYSRREYGDEDEAANAQDDGFEKVGRHMYDTKYMWENRTNALFFRILGSHSSLLGDESVSSGVVRMIEEGKLGSSGHSYIRNNGSQIAGCPAVLDVVVRKCIEGRNDDMSDMGEVDFVKMMETGESLFSDMRLNALYIDTVFWMKDSGKEDSVLDFIKAHPQHFRNGESLEAIENGIKANIENGHLDAIGIVGFLPELLKSDYILGIVLEKGNRRIDKLRIPDSILNTNEFHEAVVKKMKEGKFGFLNIFKSNPSLLEDNEIFGLFKKGMDEWTYSPLDGMGAYPKAIEDEGYKARFLYKCVKDGWFVALDAIDTSHELLDDPDVRRKLCGCLKGGKVKFEKGKHVELAKYLLSVRDSNDIMLDVNLSFALGMLENPDFFNAYSPTWTQYRNVRKVIVSMSKKSGDFMHLMRILDDRRFDFLFDLLRYDDTANVFFDIGMNFGHCLDIIFEHDGSVLSNKTVRDCALDLVRRTRTDKCYEALKKHGILDNDFVDAWFDGVVSSNMVDYDTKDGEERHDRNFLNGMLPDNRKWYGKFLEDLKNGKKWAVTVVFCNPYLLEYGEVYDMVEASVPLGSCLRQFRNEGIEKNGKRLVLRKFETVDLDSIAGDDADRYIGIANDYNQLLSSESFFRCLREALNEKDSDISSSYMSKNVASNPIVQRLIVESKARLGFDNIPILCRKAVSAKNLDYFLSEADRNSMMDEAMKEAVKNEIVDRKKMYKVFKPYAFKDIDCLKAMFRMFVDLPEFSDSVWELAIQSNSLFDIIKSEYRKIPRSMMEEFAESDDADVSWIARKRLEKCRDDSPREATASRIARRLVACDRIACRIAGEIIKGL